MERFYGNEERIEYIGYNLESIYNYNLQDVNHPIEEEQTSNALSLREDNISKEIESDSSISKFKEFLKCFICYSNVKNAVMCPSCSGFACQECLTKWINEKKAECPVCRRDLQINQIIKCRFLKDISQFLENYHLKEKELRKSKEKSDFCPDHNLEMIYYCLSCEKIICSDCVVFTENHKNHNFERLKVIFEQRMDSINKEVNELRLKINSQDNYMLELANLINQLQKRKEEKAKELIFLYRSLNQKLDQELQNNIQRIEEEKGKIEETSKFNDRMYEDISTQLEKSTPAKIISKANDFLKILVDLNSKAFKRNINNCIISDFGNDFSLPYATGVFILKPYSKQRNLNQIVYSDLLKADGITWRIKVYPNGTGIYNNQYLSLFVELVKGWENGGSYCYKVILVKPNKESENIEKEYVSDFENSICWGYNRFCKIDDIIREGFWDKENDQIILKYQVKAANHLQKINDQKNYIKDLEKKQNEQKILKKQKNEVEMKNKNVRTLSEDLSNFSNSSQILKQKKIKKLEKKNDQSEKIKNEENQESLVDIKDGKSDSFEEKIEKQSISEIDQSSIKKVLSSQENDSEIIIEDQIIQKALIFDFFN